MKMKTHSRRKSLVLLVSLFVSAIFSPSEFVECQNLFPDEILDFSGIYKVSQKQSPASNLSTLTVSPVNPRHSWSHPLAFDVFFPQSYKFGMTLATILRC